MGAWVVVRSPLFSILVVETGYRVEWRWLVLFGCHQCSLSGNTGEDTQSELCAVAWGMALFIICTQQQLNVPDVLETSSFRLL